MLFWWIKFFWFIFRTLVYIYMLKINVYLFSLWLLILACWFWLPNIFIRILFVVVYSLEAIGKTKKKKKQKLVAIIVLLLLCLCHLNGLELISWLWQPVSQSSSGQQQSNEDKYKPNKPKLSKRDRTNEPTNEQTLKNTTAILQRAITAYGGSSNVGAQILIHIFIHTFIERSWTLCGRVAMSVVLLLVVV